MCIALEATRCSACLLEVSHKAVSSRAAATYLPKLLAKSTKMYVGFWCEKTDITLKRLRLDYSNSFGEMIKNVWKYLGNRI